jgi:thiosulfate dehydrogenase [quinone] large subunit
METITKARERGIAVIRVLLGSVFLFAGTEKLLDLDGTGKAFSALGFLKFGTLGTWPGAAEDAILNPTHQFWVDLTANAAAMQFVNIIVPVGQVLIGAALILGLATRFAGVMGALMMSLFFVAAWDFGHGVINQHFVYGALALFLAYVRAGEAYGLDGYIERTTKVLQRAPVLRYVMR